MYVMFTPRTEKRKRFFHWLIDRRFNHVCVLESYPHKQVVVVLEPMIGGISLRAYDRDAATALDEAIADGVTAVLHYRNDLMYETPRYYFRGIYTCVSAVKAFLGLSGFKYFWAITPKQLYRRLLRDVKTEVIYKAGDF